MRKARPDREEIMRNWVRMLAIAALAASADPSVAGAETAKVGSTAAPTIAVAAFDYEDTSGEVRDQTAEHAARLKAFRQALEDGLTGDRYAAVSLGCIDTEACSVGTKRPAPLLEEARKAGADYFVFGEVHKMSTLVGFGRVDVLDVAEDRLVFDRVITFRGDSDAAFAHAADFVVKDVLKTLESSASQASADDPSAPVRGIR
ncbi:DUF2380 domain-containing protein [Jiella endophytica]|uniref:DUF2380 domain-containing protein n=1 Tax=Jiella endophytica TaxID=2558362 RepID=UPI001430AC66|nr:DUF2380 domain-containing protein [Jiella endophytica]